MIGAILLSTVCLCGVAPERSNDFFWENDKFGMRAYGPGEWHKWSGFDVFNKATSSNMVAEILHHPSAHGNWHQNVNGVCFDNYTMGASRGVGGIAMFADGEWKTYPDWESSRVITNTDERCEFELVYPAFSAAGKMTCHITLRRGERFFRNDVSFERMPGGFLAGPGFDLEPSRDHRGSLFEGDGVVSLFEQSKPADEGSTMTALFVEDPSAVTTMTDHLNCRVFAFKTKAFTYWAGASWDKAGEITTPEAWHDHVRAFMKGKRK